MNIVSLSIQRRDRVPSTYLAVSENLGEEPAAVDERLDQPLAGQLVEARAGLVQLQATKYRTTHLEALPDEVGQRDAARYDVHAALFRRERQIVVSQDGLEHFVLEERDLAACALGLREVPRLPAKTIPVSANPLARDRLDDVRGPHGRTRILSEMYGTDLPLPDHRRALRYGLSRSFASTWTHGKIQNRSSR